MKEIQHSPLPWKWDGPVWNYDPKNDAPWLVSDDDKGNEILTGEIKCSSRANAEFIVKACNAHSDLVASLRDILVRFVDCIGIGSEIEGDREAIAKARAVIDKATGDAA